MDESAPPQGGEMSIPIDLSQDDAPGSLERSTPLAKRLKLGQSQQSSSGSSTVGRPTGSFWPFFTRSALKQNRSHYSAFCNACTLAGGSVKVLGVAESMRSHLAKRAYVTPDLKAWAADWTKDSAPFSNDDDVDGDAVTQTNLVKVKP